MYIPDCCVSFAFGCMITCIIGTKMSLVAKKNGIRRFRPGPTQTGLYNHGRWPDP